MGYYRHVHSELKELLTDFYIAQYKKQHKIGRLNVPIGLVHNTYYKWSNSHGLHQYNIST